QPTDAVSGYVYGDPVEGVQFEDADEAVAYALAELAPTVNNPVVVNVYNAYTGPIGLQGAMHLVGRNGKSNLIFGALDATVSNNTVSSISFISSQSLVASVADTSQLWVTASTIRTDADVTLAMTSDGTVGLRGYQC